MSSRIIRRFHPLQRDARRGLGVRLRRVDLRSSARRFPRKSFSSAEQALRAGIDDLNAGDAASSVAALTYAAEGGQPIARWKLGEMYADGVGVARDDVKAYHYFNQLVEDYDEDAPDQTKPGRHLQRLRRSRRL